MGDYTTHAYVSDASERQKLDVFPADPAKDLQTAVLLVHGGAFVHGDRAAVHDRCRSYANQGITAIAVGYRLLDTAQWPAQMQDVQAALNWTVEQATNLGIDPNRIVLQGHSAGAQLAIITAAKAPAAGVPVAAVVAYYPPLAMAMVPSAGVLPAQMLLGPEATDETAAEVSPITYAGEDFPPTVLVHGTADRFIPPITSLKLFEALNSAGVQAELHLIAGQDHEFDMTPRFNAIATDTVVGFLRANIIEPEQAESEVREANPFVSMPPPGGPTV